MSTVKFKIVEYFTIAKGYMLSIDAYVKGAYIVSIQQIKIQSIKIGLFICITTLEFDF